MRIGMGDWEELRSANAGLSLPGHNARFESEFLERPYPNSHS